VSTAEGQGGSRDPSEFGGCVTLHSARKRRPNISITVAVKPK